MAWVEQTGNTSWRVRFRRHDGTIADVPGFATYDDAENYALDLDSDRRRGSWFDPTAGRITINELVPDWLDALDVDRRTLENYGSILRNHIQKRWGETALEDISNLKVKKWKKELRERGLAVVTVTGIVKLLSLLFSDAVDEHGRKPSGNASSSRTTSLNRSPSAAQVLMTWCWLGSRRASSRRQSADADRPIWSG